MTRVRLPLSLGILRKVLLFTTQRSRQFGAAGFGVEGRKGGEGGTLLATKPSRRLRSTTHRPHQHAPPPSLPSSPSGFPSGRWASTEEGARPGLNRGVMPSPHGKRLARVLARARLGYGAKTHARGGHRKGPSGNARGGGPQAPAPPPRTGLCRARGRCGRRFPRARHIHSMLDP